MRPCEVVDHIYTRGFQVPPDGSPVAVFFADWDRMPQDCEVVLYFCAVADLSGMLDDATTTDDVWDAIEHGKRLHDCEVLSDDDVTRRMQELVDVMLADRERMQRQAEILQRQGVIKPGELDEI